MTHAGEVLSQETLLEHVWDEHADPFTNTVRVTVGTLRRKLVVGDEAPADRDGDRSRLPAPRRPTPPSDRRRRRAAHAATNRWPPPSPRSQPVRAPVASSACADRLPTGSVRSGPAHGRLLERAVRHRGAASWAGSTSARATRSTNEQVYERHRVTSPRPGGQRHRRCARRPAGVRARCQRARRSRRCADYSFIALVGAVLRQPGRRLGRVAAACSDRSAASPTWRRTSRPPTCRGASTSAVPTTSCASWPTPSTTCSAASTRPSRASASSSTRRPTSCATRWR